MSLLDDFIKLLVSDPNNAKVHSEIMVHNLTLLFPDVMQKSWEEHELDKHYQAIAPKQERYCNHD